MRDRVVTVFGSSRLLPRDPTYEEAYRLGYELARRGFIVCTGGYGGVMEAVSRGAREAGGHTIGITARVFALQANAWVAEEVVVETWQQRLFALIERGQGYVVCPGGTGTLVELAVVWELQNKRLAEPRPCALLGSFWRPVIEHVARAEPVGTPGEGGRGGLPAFCWARTPTEAADYLCSHLRNRR
jgi:uncharacterized protein (TIGR00725 family)